MKNMDPGHPSEDDLQIPDKRLARLAFDKAAARYDEFAVLQQEVCTRLLERLDYIRIKPKMVLDAGCGTGQASVSLVNRFSSCRLVAMDFSHAMLGQAATKRRWRRKFDLVCGDVERLALADESVDLVVSNLTFQWCSDLATVFGEFRRVLKPGGLLLFSSFGPGTLQELRASWTQVDGFSHVNRFLDLHTVGDELLHSGFSDPVMDMEMFTLTYADVFRLMRDLKGIGAHNVTLGRQKSLMGKHRLRQLADAYESFRQQDVLPASYEVVYGHAWTGAKNPGVSGIPVKLEKPR